MLDTKQKETLAKITSSLESAVRYLLTGVVVSIATLLARIDGKDRALLVLDKQRLNKYGCHDLPQILRSSLT